MRSFSNKPLTLFEVMRDVGHEARRTVKSHIIQFLANEIGEGHLTMDDIQAIVTQEIVMLDDASISDHVVGDRMGGTMNLPPNVIDSLDQQLWMTYTKLHQKLLPTNTQLAMQQEWVVIMLRTILVLTKCKVGLKDIASTKTVKKSIATRTPSWTCRWSSCTQTPRVKAGGK